MNRLTISVVVLAAVIAHSAPVAGQQSAVLPDSLQTIVWAQNPCAAELERQRTHVPPHWTYSALGDSAIFVVRPNGQVQLRPRKSIDENDAIVVHLVTDRKLADYLQVVRKSAFGLPDSLVIAGAGTVVPTLAPVDRARTSPERAFDECVTLVFPLQDFAVGKGEVGIVAVTNQGPKTVGAFEFGVRRLYTGALSLAFVHSRIRNPTFGLTPRTSDGDTVITVTSTHRRNLFSVFYTPFLWGRRDLQKFTGNPLSYLNPTFGLSLNEFGKNAMAGVSAEIPTAGVSVMLGWHAGRVSRIDPNSGYAVGDPFNGSASSIPLEEVWEIRRFVGVGLDLRAAVQFVAAATGGGKGK